MPTYRAERDQASLLSSAGDPHTFSTTPSSPILTLSNSQFSIFAGRRILQPVYPFSTVLKCPRCSKDMDPYGDHTLLCLTRGLRVRTKYWHDPLCRRFNSILASQGLRTELERASLTTSSLLPNKRADILIHAKSSTYSTICDIRTAISTQPSITPQSCHRQDVQQIKVS